MQIIKDKAEFLNFPHCIYCAKKLQELIFIISPKINTRAHFRNLFLQKMNNNLTTSFFNPFPFFTPTSLYSLPLSLSFYVTYCARCTTLYCEVYKKPEIFRDVQKVYPTLNIAQQQVQQQQWRVKKKKKRQKHFLRDIGRYQTCVFVMLNTYPSITWCIKN